MAHDFRSEKEISQIITEMYKLCYPAGLLCELAFLRNFRKGDIRFAKAGHFRESGGYPEIYLNKTNKTQINTWMPIPKGIYNKIIRYIMENDLQPDDYLFEITKKHSGIYYNHRGVISNEWLNKLWIKACDNLGVLTKTKVTLRDCTHCPHFLGKLRCIVFGIDKPKNRDFVNINNCREKGAVKTQWEWKPNMHESLRGVGAQSKIKSYMEHCSNCGTFIDKFPKCMNKKCPKCGHKGYDYDVAKHKIFIQSNWKNWTVYNRYMSSALERQIGDGDFVADWGDKTLI